MAQDKYFERRVKQYDKLERQKERKEKWSRRERGFWKTFLFTKDGKPKSSLMIYTFSLSFLFLAIYVASLFLLIDWMNPVVESWPPVLGNMLIALLGTTIGLLVGVVLHNTFTDKRLVFGAHLWLALYLIACLATGAVFLRGDAGLGEFISFFCWFFLPPVAIGSALFGFFCWRDFEAPVQSDDLQPWHKYTRR